MIDITKINKMFGDAKLSAKHSNFLINEANASSKDMKILSILLKKMYIEN